MFWWFYVRKNKCFFWAVATAMIIILGIYFSIKLRFPQLRIGKFINPLKLKMMKMVYLP